LREAHRCRGVYPAERIDLHESQQNQKKQRSGSNERWNFTKISVTQRQNFHIRKIRTLRTCQNLIFEKSARCERVKISFLRNPHVANVGKTRF